MRRRDIPVLVVAALFAFIGVASIVGIGVWALSELTETLLGP